MHRLFTRFIFLFLSYYLKMYWRCMKHHPSSLPQKEAFTGEYPGSNPVPSGWVSRSSKALMAIPEGGSQGWCLIHKFPFGIPAWPQTLNICYFTTLPVTNAALLWSLKKNQNGHFGVNLNINSENQVKEVTTILNLLSSLSLLWL